ncbi:Tubulin gamma chain [Teratosphaeria destructans]|uniref:Tubulin gamma chain n=1 Tax=Teratosphaeria destructans TaxID=418781 RepID=A0A9W7SWJ6_9PEZI|nr:Tubulin gamma chain [Teratosphaeria destructans]
MKLLTSCCLLLASLATTTVHAHNATPDIHPRKNTSHAIPDVHTRKNITRIPNRPEPLRMATSLTTADTHTRKNTSHATPDVHTRKNITRIPDQPEPLRKATSLTTPDTNTPKNTSHATPDMHTRKNTTSLPTQPELLRMANPLPTPEVHTRKNTTRIPNQTELLRMANSLATNDTSPFFSRVAANVIWDVLGTHQAAGHYTSLGESPPPPPPHNPLPQDPRIHLHELRLTDLSRQPAAWRKNAFGVIQRVLEKPLRLSVRNVIGGRPQSWAVLELEAHSRCKNGLHYDQDYAWVMKFDEEGMIVHVSIVVGWWRRGWGADRMDG